MKKADKNLDKIYGNFTYSQKAALLLIALGKKWAVELMRLMKKDEVKLLAYWINQMGYIPQELTERVVKEFYDQISKKSLLTSSGGIDYLNSVLGGMMPEHEAKELLTQVNEQVANEDNEVFRILKRVDPEKLAAYFKHEQPQIVALLLSHLPTARTTKIISSLSEEMKAEIVMRIAKMNEIDPDVIAAVEEKLTANLSSMARADQREFVDKDGGLKEAAKILNSLGKEQSKEILDAIVEKDFDLATGIKDWILVFDDILLLDNVAVQKVISKVPQKDLIFAMKNASEDVKEKIFSNMSRGQCKIIKGELAFMGPVKASSVKDAQKKVVNTMRELEEEGIIIISGKGGGGGDVIA